MKKSNIFWGVILILLACLVIISAMGWTMGIGFWSIVFTVLFIALFIKGIVNLDFSQILFPIAFLCIIWDEVLGIERLTPWPVLFAALLGTIGLNLIFGNMKIQIKRNREFGEKVFEKNFNKSMNIQEERKEYVKCCVRFSSIVKYINSANLQRVDVSAMFGAASLYLDNACAPSGEVLIDVNATFSGIEIFIPRDWRVINKTSATFGGVDENGGSSGAGIVDVVLTGNVNFSGIEIKYI